MTYRFALPALPSALLAFCLLPALAGCTAPMGETAARYNVTPRLVPIDPILASIDPTAATPDPGAGVAGSAEDLRRRAAALRGM